MSGSLARFYYHRRRSTAHPVPLAVVERLFARIVHLAFGRIGNSQWNDALQQIPITHLQLENLDYVPSQRDCINGKVRVAEMRIMGRVRCGSSKSAPNLPFCPSALPSIIVSILYVTFAVGCPLQWSQFMWPKEL